MRSCSSFTNCIVDVCQNPGGDLDELDSILEQFLPENTPYILARERAYDSTTHQYHTVDFRPLKTKRPASPYLAGKKVVVLMDGGSASAAEILALGLKDGYGAILAGNTSYGKAIGQIKLPRRGRKWLQITFLQLKGISAGEYQNKGLKPDIVISNIDMYNQGTSLLSVVRLVEPGVKAADIRKPSSSLKKVASAIPEGYVIRDVELGP
jgi:carboxyl-terminal processing protease